MSDDTFFMLDQAMPATARHLFLANYRLNVETCKALLGYQAELLSFFKRRFELYQTFLDDLVESVELHDTFEVVADFTQNALADAPRESARLARITSKMGSEAAKVVRELADETVEDMAARTCA
ncbi:hypothetical protein Rleg10DRAFT_3747 [Rhizobium leguminosarum bv. trifolii WSM2012]|nr:hypothetical protein Rleg10DRAFT_3747 [Rhizobium leguminosarum bv. trifolii WSM2012]